MAAAYDAAKIAEQRRQESLTNKHSFITESTFSHPSKLLLLDDAKIAGFRTVIYHVNVRSPNISVDRVAERVKEGGHNVPEDKIRGRYERNKDLIKEAAIKADRAFIYDNSKLNKPSFLVMSMKQGIVDRLSENVPTWARELYKEQLKPYSQSRQNAAAFSFNDIKQVAQTIAGDKANVLIPDTKKQQYYQGQVVGESSLHLLQQTGEKGDYTAHFKGNMDKRPKLGDNMLVDYQSKSKAVVSTPYEKGTLPHLDQIYSHLQQHGLDPTSINKIMSNLSQRVQFITKQTSTIGRQEKNSDLER